MFIVCSEEELRYGNLTSGIHKDIPNGILGYLIAASQPRKTNYLKIGKLFFDLQFIFCIHCLRFLIKRLFK